MTTFQKRFFQAVDESGMNFSEVARAVGVTRAAVSRWKLGLSVPRTETLAHVARVLNVSTDWLLGVSSKP